MERAGVVDIEDAASRFAEASTRQQARAAADERGERDEPDELDEGSLNVFGRIHSEESFSCVDGPGIRYLVFAQGCHLRCLFCSNPDTWARGDAHGEWVGSRDLADRVERLAAYLRPGRGGVTVSGGDPLAQPSFVAALFRAVRRAGMTTCLDTSGFGTRACNWDVVLPHTDHVMFCVKHIRPDKYKELTGAEASHAFGFAAELARRRIPFQLRYVLIPGHTDDPADVDALIAWAKGQPTMLFIELLPYHELGRHKWTQLGLRFKLDGVGLPTRAQVGDFARRCRAAGVEVRCAWLDE